MLYILFSILYRFYCSIALSNHLSLGCSCLYAIMAEFINARRLICQEWFMLDIKTCQSLSNISLVLGLVILPGSTFGSRAVLMSTILGAVSWLWFHKYSFHERWYIYQMIYIVSFLIILALVTFIEKNTAGKKQNKSLQSQPLNI